MRIDMHSYRGNPQLRLTLELAARRERAQALGRLFANVFSRMKVGHAARTHLAQQG